MKDRVYLKSDFQAPAWNQSKIGFFKATSLAALYGLTKLFLSIARHKFKCTYNTHSQIFTPKKFNEFLHGTFKPQVLSTRYLSQVLSYNTNMHAKLHFEFVRYVYHDPHVSLYFTLKGCFLREQTIRLVCIALKLKCLLLHVQYNVLYQILASPPPLKGSIITFQLSTNLILLLSRSSTDPVKTLPKNPQHCSIKIGKKRF